MGIISTYDELKTELSTKIGRSDDDFVNSRDLFIDFAEADFNRRLRTSQMEEELTDTADANGNITLPGDFLVMRSVRRSGSPNIELQPISMGGENRLSPYDTAGEACFYSISGTTLRVTPIEAAELILTYFEKIPALTASNTTNWLLALAPDAYYYMSLAHYYAWNEDMEMAQAHKGYALEVLKELRILDSHAGYHNAGIVLDMPVVP